MSRSDRKVIVTFYRFWNYAAFIMFVLYAGFISGQNASAATTIDETMPAAIPQQIIDDWETQDKASSVGYSKAVSTIAATLSGDFAQTIKDEMDKISSATDPAWKNLYLKACHYRRISRMKPYSEDIQDMLFTKHHNFGNQIVGFLEALDMIFRDAEWTDSSALCRLQLKNYYSQHTYLLKDKAGVIKDPVVSFDGKKVLFSYSKKEGYQPGGFHLFEMDIDNPSNIKQITSNPSGLVVSDMEPAYLPNGDIVFNSSRNFGMVDCAYQPTSNLYVCNSAGKYIRRVGFDQVHTFHPVLMSDGKVMYTRWEYNDRMITSAMGLFTMNPDGTHQTEYYGNQTAWPMTVIHGRQIPNTKKVIAVISGHTAPYAGDLVIIDPNIARNGAKAVQLIAPKRPNPTNTFVGTDGGVEPLFQNPWPLDEDNFLVSWRPTVDTKIYKLYFMNIDGTRELIAWDNQSLSQPNLIKERKKPLMPAVTVDYRKTTGAFTMQDIYQGTGLMKSSYGSTGTSVPRGTIKKLRVITLEYRIQGTWQIGETGAAAGHEVCPVSGWLGSWDPKTILGETPVYEDGSASFIVPARTPVYFQAIDSNGNVVQTMRSWSTLQPGETFSCIGCHEDKNLAPPPGGVPMAGDPKPLQPFHGLENKAFNYKKIVQPIFDDKCVSCHKQNHTSGVDLRGDLIYSNDMDKSDTKLADWVPAKRYFTTSYVTLTKDIKKYVNWIDIFSPVTPLAAYPAGSVSSPLLTKTLKGVHHDISLSKEEKEIISAWIDLCVPHAGTYNEFMKPADSTTFEKLKDKFRAYQIVEQKNIQEFIDAGQYGTPVDNNVNHSKHSFFKKSGIRYLPKQHTLVLDKVREGNLLIMDLNGRILSRSKLINKTGEALSVPLSVSLSRGLYVARLEENGSVQENLISIIR